MILLSNQPTNQPNLAKKNGKFSTSSQLLLLPFARLFFFGKKWPTAKMLQVHAHDYTTKLRIQKINTPRNRIRIIGWVRSQSLGSHLTMTNPGNQEIHMPSFLKSCHAKRVGFICYSSKWGLSKPKCMLCDLCFFFEHVRWLGWVWTRIMVMFSYCNIKMNLFWFFLTKVLTW